MINEKSGITLTAIPGVDVHNGITMTGGTEANYRKVLSIFRKDAEERLPLLLEQITPGAQDLSMFTTQVHALKSASAIIGALQTSVMSAELESAGKAGDIDLIRKKLPEFAQHLKELTVNINTALKQLEAENHDAPDASGSAVYTQLVNELEEALVQKKASSSVLSIMDGFDKITLDSKTREILDQISNMVLMSEFDSAMEIIKEIKRSMAHN